VYGPRDEVDLAKIGAVGLPFWLAGDTRPPSVCAEPRSRAPPGSRWEPSSRSARSRDRPHARVQVLKEARGGSVGVRTDPLASPTGFPFKSWSSRARSPRPRSSRPGSALRPRYLREVFRTEDGGLGYRCPAEPVDDFLRKGGKAEDIVGRKCICNGLMATAGLAAVARRRTRAPRSSRPATDLKGPGPTCSRLDRDSYTAADVVDIPARPPSGLSRGTEGSSSVDARRASGAGSGVPTIG